MLHNWLIKCHYSISSKEYCNKQDSTVHTLPLGQENPHSGNGSTVVILWNKHLREVFHTLSWEGIVRWVVGSIPYGWPIELFLIPASTPQLV